MINRITCVAWNAQLWPVEGKRGLKSNVNPNQTKGTLSVTATLVRSRDGEAIIFNTKGQLVPSARLIWLHGETMVSVEAEYQFGIIADGKEP